MQTQQLRGSAPPDDRHWSGRLAIRPGHALFVGRAGDNSAHAHQAIQLCIAARGSIAVELIGDRRIEGAAIALAAGVPHRLDAAGREAALLYLDPRAASGAIAARWLGRSRARPRNDAEARHVRALLARGANASEVVAPMLAAFGIEASIAGRGDARVARAIDWIEANLRHGRVAAGAVACAAGLSPSRLSALFRAETGVALRPFVLWLRLRISVAEIAAGRSPTDAALVAGFADAAHLSRTFRRMFGTTLGASVARFGSDA